MSSGRNLKNTLENIVRMELGKTANRYTKAGGYSADFDLPTYFLHDVPAAVLREGPSRPREQADAVLTNHAVLSVGRRYRSTPLPQRTTASSPSISKNAWLGIA